MEVKRATTDALECHVSFDYGTDKAVGDEAVEPGEAMADSVDKR